ncbi:MAG: hypothetical protein KDA52_10975, partial [Planctomycetaceae bacterium]|nr:hypothetical protein [Planctomycetaceae bacterium]
TPPALLHFAGMVVILGFVSGCGGSPPPAAVVKPPTPQIQPLDGPVLFEEGISKRFEPVIANRDEINGGLRFELLQGELPDKCEFDQSSGALEWTPDEFQGSSHHNLRFSCALEDDPTVAAEYAVELEIQEVNLPPKLVIPGEITISAGSILEQPVRPSDDDDFPVNQITLSLDSGPQGASIDAVRKLVYWEIPADWQQPQVEFVVSARDDGVPPLTTTQQFVVSIKDIVPPKPENAEESRFRVPEYAVDLPPLPQVPLGKQADPIESTTLELRFDPPLDATDVRVSLMLPHELRADLKTRYPDEHDESHLAILLTESFEAEKVAGNLTDNIVATCRLTDSILNWTWALTKDLDARGYQNNVRSGVLVIGSKSGKEPRLVALQSMKEVLAPTLESILNSEKLLVRLTACDRVKKSIPFVGLGCQANNGTWTTELEAQIDGFALHLFSAELTNQVNRGARVNHMEFAEFHFRVLPKPKEISIGLDADPSPADVKEKFDSARNLLQRHLGDLRERETKLNGARAELASANKVQPRNEIEQIAKTRRINRANSRIQDLSKQVADLNAKIPGDENNLKVKQAEWDAIVAQLEPFRTCLVTGELHRQIGDDVRIPVYRLVAVADDPAVDAQQE